MHTFLATAYLIGESSILHLAAGPQKQLYWLNGFWKPLKCDFAENPSQSENPKGKYAFSPRTIIEQTPLFIVQNRRILFDRIPNFI